MEYKDYIDCEFLPFKLVKKGNSSYIVYADGAVYSIKKNMFLKHTMTRSGYLITGRLGYLHRVLVKCFIGDIPEGFCVNHKDGNKTNNNLDNLEIVTYSENTRHAYRTGLAKGLKGQNNSMAKLSDEVAEKLFKDLKLGLSNVELGLKYNLHPRYVSLIRSGRRWKHLYEKYGKNEVSKHDPNPEMTKKHLEFMKMDLSRTNVNIGRELGVDPSTISRWRHNKTRAKQ